MDPLTSEGSSPADASSAEPAEPDVTVDFLLGGRVRLFQPKRGYRAAIDPVLLAAAVGARPGERVLDAGCGTGAASLCLAVRCPEVAITGLERDRDALALARASVAAAGLETRIRLVEGDLSHPPAAIRRTAFDWVASNPPFLAPERARVPVEPGRAAARVETVEPARWIAACLARLAPGGRLVLVHRADRLPELAAALRGRAGEITIFPLWPKEGEPARRILLRARKGSRAPARLLPGLVLHRPDGRYTEAAEAVLRGAEPIRW
jgi:tRNA1(Val) A37 N6-methylase TrmN6